MECASSDDLAGWAAVPAGWTVTRRAVAAQCAAVGAGGGGGAVGMQAQGPAPAGDEVMDLAAAGGLVAAGERAVRVAGGHGAAQVGGDGGLGLAGVQRDGDIE